MRVLVVDGANVVGSRPDGWWKDRAGAAQRLHARLMTADLPAEQVVLVLEGQAKGGHPAGQDGDVRTVHAPRDGDATILQGTREAVDAGASVTVVTADRELRLRAEMVGADTRTPGWLLDLLDG